MEMEFTQRIQKLESDINLISSIRDILMSNDTFLRNNESQDVEIPVRDVSLSSINGETGENFNKKKAVSNSSSILGLIKNTNLNNNKGSSSSKRSKLINTRKSERDENGTTNQEEESSITIDRLHEEIAHQIKKRLDVEESAKIVMIRLQKVEDDIQREKEIKKSLLEGTLEMKNQLQGYHFEISELEKRITHKQLENCKLSKDLQELENNKIQSSTQYETQLELLQNEKDKAVQQNVELEKKLEIIQTSMDKLKSELAKNHDNFTMDENKMKIQYETLLEKFTKLDEQKGKIEQQLQLTRKQLEILKEKLTCSDLKLKNQQQDFSIQLKEKQDEIKTLNCKLKKERFTLSQKIDAAINLVSKTKSFIINLQNEKQIKENQTHKYLLDIRQLEQEKGSLEQRVNELMRNSNNQDNFRERFWSLNQESIEKTRILEQDRDKLKQQLNAEIETGRDLAKRVEILQNEIENIGEKCQNEKMVQESKSTSIREELSRVSDNLKVLQKISEDQGKTITKQRNELESNSELKYKLEIQLRESQETEKTLMLRLNDEEKSLKDADKEISRLEHELLLISKEVKEHDCEDFVESKFIGKVKELERKVSHLEGEIVVKDDEKNIALTTARKAVTQATQIKDSCEEKILKMKKSSSNEILKIRQEYQQKETETSKKICDLESELVKTRESYRQMQNAYITKIQQLQTALLHCCGSGVGVGLSSSSTSSHQQHGINNPLFQNGFSIPGGCAANFNVNDGFQNLPFL